MKVKRLTAVRQAKGRTQAWVAREAQVDQGRMSLIERGRYVPYPTELRRIAAVLDHEGDPDRLLDDLEVQYVEP